MEKDQRGSERRRLRGVLCGGRLKRGGVERSLHDDVEAKGFKCRALPLVELAVEFHPASVKY